MKLKPKTDLSDGSKIDNNFDRKELQIVSQIKQAVMDRKIAPGAKLPEKTLCDIFNASRMHVRQALLLLSADQIIELKSNRGAFISKPSQKAARNVFETRRLIEPVIVSRMAGNISKSDTKVLQKHIRLQEKAHQNEDHHKNIELSGQFHIILMTLYNNKRLTTIIENAVLQTSLIIGLYGKNKIICLENEHQLIIDAIVNDNPNTASQLMEAHLNHIESEIELEPSKNEYLNLTEALG